MTASTLSLARAVAVRNSLRAGKTVFRGMRDGGRPSDPGDLGIGTYYSSRRYVARGYGTPQESKVRLANPFVLSTEDAYARIADPFVTCCGTWESRKAGATAATRVMRCLGFDGLVAVDPNRRNLWEIVVFPKPVSQSGARP